MKRHGIILSGLVSISAALRLFNISRNDIWFDEATSIVIAHSKTFPEFIQRVRLYDLVPPLYVGLLHFWIKFFGDSIVSVRLPSVIFGVVTVVLIYFFGKKLFGQMTGTIAAIFATFSPFLIIYSQEAKSYSLFAFLSVLSFYVFFQAAEKKNFFWWSLYTVCSILLLYTHIYATFVIFAQVASLMARIFMRRNSFKDGVSVIFCLIIIFLAFTPWLVYLKQSIQTVQKDFWIPQITSLSLGETLNEYAPFVSVMLFGLFWLSFFKIKNKHEKGNSFLRWNLSWKITHEKTALFLWFLFPLLLPALISLVFRPVYQTRYTIPASLAFFLLAAYGMSSLKKPIAVGLLVIYVAVSCLVTWSFFNKVEKHPWRSFITYLAPQLKAGDIIAYTTYEDLPFTYAKNHLDCLLPKILTVNADVSNLEKVVSRRNRIWVIKTPLPSYKKELVAELKTNYTIQKDMSYEKYGIHLSLLTRRED